MSFALQGVPSALCIGFADSARLNEDGEQELSDFNTFVDLQGLLVRYMLSQALGLVLAL